MILLNFSHPLTSEQLTQVETFTGQAVAEIRLIEVQFENGRSFFEQIVSLVDACDLSAEEWQSRRILIVPPALNFIAATLLAEIHGRMGYFPSIVRLRPVEYTTPQEYEVAEVLNLQKVRDSARQRRSVKPDKEK